MAWSFFLFHSLTHSHARSLAHMFNLWLFKVILHTGGGDLMLLLLYYYDIIANYKVNWVTSEWRPKRMAMTHIYILNGNKHTQYIYIYIDSATSKFTKRKKKLNFHLMSGGGATAYKRLLSTFYLKKNYIQTLIYLFKILFIIIFDLSMINKIKYRLIGNINEGDGGNT